MADATGARIPAAQITATNTNTGIVTTRVSNETGNYNIPSLQPGPYTIEVSVPGFQTATIQVNLTGDQLFRRNFELQVGTLATEIEVVPDADALLASPSASVGLSLPEIEVFNLPLSTRDVLAQVDLTPGAVGDNFAGARVSAVHTTRDGLTVSDGRYLNYNGAFSATFSSPDLVEQVQVSVATVDASAGRGSAQVRLQTRSGTNQFHGALFWSTNNSALNAQTWQNNLVGAEKSWENRNQFGGRLGGPIIPNKAFFFILIEEQRYKARENFVGTVLTPEASRGNFRYWPGVRNGNFLSSSPSVDLGGNPVRPVGASGDLQSFNVFTDVDDPFRTAPSTAPFIQETLRRMPAPNDFTTGDGLNTAGHRWARTRNGVDNAFGSSPNSNRDQLNLRFDYQINDSNKVNFAITREETSGETPPNWPGGFPTTARKFPEVISTAWTSTISPSVLNEFRFGRRTSSFHVRSAFTEGCCFGDDDGFNNLTPEAQEIFDSFVPKVNGYPFLPSYSLLRNHWINWAASGNASPLYQFADTVSWTQGAHTFKAGWEGSWSGSDGWNRVGQGARLGAGNFPVQGIDSRSFRGLQSADAGRARSLLTDLAGSVASYRQLYVVNDPAVGFVDNLTTMKFGQNNHQDDWAAYIKDTWNLTTNLTLNLGLRYDKYGVLYEARGLAPVSKTGDLEGFFGPSGQLTQLEPVGKNSPNPDKSVYNADWNNFAPSFGFSWNVPFIDRTTVVRGGYGISYAGAATFLEYATSVGLNPGTSFGASAIPTTYQNLLDIQLPIPLTIEPFGTIPFTDRRVNVSGYEPNRTIPYIQNFNLSIQTALGANTNLSVTYLGTKGSQLYGVRELNEPDIFNNGILDAFLTTRAGGDAPLFDQMLGGMNFGQSIGRVGRNGLTGSSALRRFGTTDNWIADGEVGRLAEWLNQTNSRTGEFGGLLRTNGFPENFIVLNPQFNSVRLYGNPDNSTYHSLQTQVTKRLSNGVSGQFTYTWSRALGNAVVARVQDTGRRTRDHRNLSLQKGLQPFHRTHAFDAHGTWGLPFGPGRMLLSGAPGWVHRIVESWQLSSIFSWTSGRALGITTDRETLGAEASISTPDLVGNFPKSIGEVVVGDGRVDYFEGLTRRQESTAVFGSDPDQLFRCHNLWEIVDSAGNVLLRNAAPGTSGNLSNTWFEGPSRLGLDVALAKSIQIREGINFMLRMDAINVLNTPQWHDPNWVMNSVNFGRISGASGARKFTAVARIDF